MRSLPDCSDASGALAKIFGSESEGERRIVSPQCTLLVRVSYFLPDLAPLLSGATFAPDAGAICLLGRGTNDGESNGYS
jgi:hypothetical protein